jgi:hypothetical protein
VEKAGAPVRRQFKIFGGLSSRSLNQVKNPLFPAALRARRPEGGESLPFAMQLIRSEKFGLPRNLKQFETTSELSGAAVVATWRPRVRPHVKR